MSLDVCLILEGIPDINKIGGVNSWLKDLITGLPEINFSVINFSNKENSSNFSNNYRNLKFFKNIYIKDYPFTLKEVLSIIKDDETPNADVFHATSTGCASLYGMYLSDINNKPFILTEHAIYWKEALETHELECGIKFSENEAVVILKSIAKEAYKKAITITTPTNYTRNIQIDNGAEPNKCSVIQNGIDFNKYKFQTNKFPPKKIGFVGRITRIKNIERILEIGILLINNDRTFELNIIGPIDDVKYYNELKNKSKEVGLDKNINFTGKIDREKWIDLIDILVLTSKMETQPYVILEALASGILPIAYDVGGISETLKNTGILFENDTSPDIISSRVMEIVNNKELFEEKTKEGRKVIEVSNNIVNMLFSYNNIYNKVGLQ
jgi:polysaccharide biosynthesis protein PelF